MRAERAGGERSDARQSHLKPDGSVESWADAADRSRQADLASAFNLALANRARQMGLVPSRPEAAERPRQDDPANSIVKEAGTSSVLETAGEESKSFFSKTAQALMTWVGLRLVDLIAPGVGAAISACERVVTIVQDIKALIQGSGDISFPVGTFDGFEVRAQVHFGDDPEGRDLPFSAYISPCEGDSLLEQVDMKPDSHHRYAAMIKADLSRLSGLPEPASRAGVVRSYTEQEILPRLRRYDDEEVELVYVYDEKSGVGAWMRVSNGRTNWCILVWISPARFKIHPSV
jgi:hypothetical protein